jgi:hypothetical protein
MGRVAHLSLLAWAFDEHGPSQEYSDMLLPEDRLRRYFVRVRTKRSAKKRSVPKDRLQQGGHVCRSACNADTKICSVNYATLEYIDFNWTGFDIDHTYWQRYIYESLPSDAVVLDARLNWNLGA